MSVEKDVTMISYELLDFEELDVLRKLIDPLRLDDVISEYGSERDLQEYLGLDEFEFEEWKKVWFE